MKVTERWHSPRMDRDITMVRWGHYGVPVLLFPTAGGDAEEVERHKLIRFIQPLVDAGRIKVYSCDSAAGKAMQADEGSTEYRMWLFNAYQQAIAAEVVPAIAEDSSGSQPIIAAGASIGAFNALAVTCRFPHLFDAAICMSGTYDISRFIGGPFTDDLYFASPLQFLPGLEGAALDRLRQASIVLASGSGDWENVGESWNAANALGAKGVPNRVDDWGPGYKHDWPTWWEMLPLYLDQLVP
ncbi:MAG: alpha/beta hydrolase-fold protein [Nostocoides sp.]